MEPTAALIQREADMQGKSIVLVHHLCEGAFEAVSNGDTETHDRIVKAGLAILMNKVDVIVLAQASMARVVDAIPDSEKVVPSPRLGVAAAKTMMDAVVSVH